MLVLGHLAVPLLIYLVLGFLGPVTAVVDFTQCLSNIRNETWRQEFQISDGGTDNHGRPMPFSNVTTAITYDLCVNACGSGPEPMRWTIFSQQFSAWLLPWLALVSQLPFGANDKFDNFVAMLLTVGSPTLAAYSLALTVLNGRWIARRFSAYNYPNTRNAVRILSSLQQSPLRVSSDESLLSSLVVLHENDEWWTELVVWLDYTYTWSISAAASIIWVIIAYLFTVVDSFSGDVETSLNANGQGVGSLWLWLLPVVVGWLQISPKCDCIRLHQAVSRANRIAYVATPYGEPELVGLRASECAISLQPGTGDALRRDEGCTVPIFNYARFFSWVEVVETVADAFLAASERAKTRMSVNPEIEWAKEKKLSSRPHVLNRMGTLAQVEEYCAHMGESQHMRRTGWGPGVWSRMFVASVLALSLQWGTTGAAVVVNWFTPTTGQSNRSDECACCSHRTDVGLGCRSGSYILYAAISSLVWLLLVASSILSHYVTTTSRPVSKSHPRIARLTSIGLRRVGKVLAACNAVWIVVACMFQFSNFFDRCYCDSSVFMWGTKKAYMVLDLTNDDIHDMISAWIGGVFLAAGSALIFVIFVNIFINPQLPTQPGD